LLLLLLLLVVLVVLVLVLLLLLLLLVLLLFRQQDIQGVFIGAPCSRILRQQLLWQVCSPLGCPWRQLCWGCWDWDAAAGHTTAVGLREGCCCRCGCACEQQACGCFCRD
jgi:hypothetical protein